MPALTSATLASDSDGMGDCSSVHVRAATECFVPGMPCTRLAAFSSSMRVTRTFCPMRASSRAIADDLLRRLALAEDHLGDALADRAVVIDHGEAEIRERELP